MSIELDVTREDPTKRYFPIEYQLEGKLEWRTATTLSTDKTSALQNFLTDFSPSHGIVTAVRIPN
jgi:hypothetical protein